MTQLTYVMFLCDATSNSKSGPYVCKASTTSKLCTVNERDVSYGLFVKFVLTSDTWSSATARSKTHKIKGQSNLQNDVCLSLAGYNFWYSLFSELGFVLAFNIPPTTRSYEDGILVKSVTKRTGKIRPLLYKEPFLTNLNYYIITLHFLHL